MKETLIVLPVVPYPLTSGGNIAVFEMINYLRNKVKITLVMPNNGLGHDVKLRELWDNVDLVYYKETDSQFEKGLRRLSEILQGLALKLFARSMGVIVSKGDTALYRNSRSFGKVNADLVKVVNRLLESRHFDYVQIEFFKLLPLVCFLPNDLNTIFVHHEIRFVRLRREMDLVSLHDGFKKFFIHAICGLEVELLRQYSKVVTVSDVDKQILGKYLPSSSIVSSPLTIRVPKVDSSFSFQDTLYFVGGAKHEPNVDGLKWFLEECWPELVSRYPNCELKVIGAWSNALIRRFDLRNVSFLGFVEDLSSVFKDGILVVPLRIGSGMRMKIVDAVNYGLPIVTTSVGVEGLALRNGVDCYIEDSPSRFVQCIVDLSQDEGLQRQFIANSRNALARRYSYEYLTSLRESLYV